MNKIIKQRLTVLYKQGKATIITINNAVIKGWLTQADADEIINSK